MKREDPILEEKEKTRPKTRTFDLQTNFLAKPRISSSLQEDTPICKKGSE
jgi:hypothetical protein